MKRCMQRTVVALVVWAGISLVLMHGGLYGHTVSSLLCVYKCGGNGNVSGGNRASGLSATYRTALKTDPWLPRFHLVAVACGNRAPETLTMLKSAAALTRNAVLVLHVFSENNLQKQFFTELQSWPKQYSDRTEFRVYNITFPAGDNGTWWKTIFTRPCAYQRLFLHSLLTEVDAVLYVDTDTLFLTSVAPIWNVFTRFNATQLLGLVANHENKKGGGWYKRISRTPYIQPSGVNSGVILMNLTRLRQSNWSQAMWNYSHLYRRKLLLVDQDLINIYLHFHPDQLYWMDCALNYRTDHCMNRRADPSSACLSAENQGVQILHGSRRAFQARRPFYHVYQVFAQHRLGGDLRTGLLYEVRGSLRKMGLCSSVAPGFERRLADTIAKIEPPDDVSTKAKRQG